MKNISRYSLDASAISLISYDEERKHLEVTFRRGGVQTYTGVPRLCLAELLSAKSKAAYLREHVAPKYFLIQAPMGASPTPNLQVASTEPVKSRKHETLFDFVPPASIAHFHALLAETPVTVKIVRRRLTKHGDFHFDETAGVARITMSRSENKSQFALTLIHEIAHAVVHFTHGRKAAPHGIEWKTQYSLMLHRACDAGVFDAELLAHIRIHADAPYATAGRDVALSLALERQVPSSSQPLVMDLPAGAHFRLRGQTFIKGRPLRKSFECKTLEGKKYRVSATARIDGVVATEGTGL